MKKIHYRKLVRDNVPAKIMAKGSELEFRRMDAKEFEVELLKKVGEEAAGLLTAISRDELISELADVMEVLDEIKRFKKIKSAEISERQREFRLKKGAFKQRFYLEWSADDKYKTNEPLGKKKSGKRS